MVKIITDTLSDMPPALAEALGVTVIPLNLHFGGKTYRDRVDICSDEFYRRLTTRGEVYPTTSAPAPGVFVEVFKTLARETDAILCVHASGKMSATVESARQARNLVKLPCRIEVVDTRLIAGPLMMAAIEAAEAARAGGDLDAVLAVVGKAAPRCHIRIWFDTLEYLRRGGRIGKASALLGGLLKMQPVLTIKDGGMFPHSRVRSQAAGLETLLALVSSHPQIKRMVVEDATTPEVAGQLVEKLGAYFPREKIVRSVVTPVLGAHTGPHAMAVSIMEGE